LALVAGKVSSMMALVAVDREVEVLGVFKAAQVVVEQVLQVRNMAAATTCRRCHSHVSPAITPGYGVTNV
jgi:cytochrome c553